VTVQVIHEAALQVLGEVGYDRLTTTLVAARAGVSVGTLYQYYADKHGLARALIVEYLEQIEQAMKAVLEEEQGLPTLARHFVRRFLAFKLEQRLRGTALRSVFVLSDAQEVLNRVTRAVIKVLGRKIALGRPRWSASRVHQCATMWATMLAGSTAEMLDRDPAQIAEPWFADAMETALLALLD
jgi:AcrR family transcriptional regulator